jgi:hypothetical protein
LFTYSEEFDDADWNKTGVTVTSNDEVAPDGETTADTIIGENGTSGAHRIDGGAITVTSGVYVISWFVKKSNMPWCSLRQGSNEGGSNQPSVWFNLDTGEKGGTLNSPLDSEIKSFPNGWFRISMTVDIVGTTINPQLRITPNDLVVPFTSNGTEQLIAWGAQLEKASTASSYIPTVASTVTRNADVISKTGISALIGQTEGTIYAEVDVRNFQVNGRVLAISDGTNNNRVTIFFTTSNRFRLLVTTGGSGQFGLNSSASFSPGVFKVAVGYKTDDFAIYVNGVQIGVNTSASVPACSAVFLGTAEDGSTNPLNDHIKAAAILPTRLSNAELAALTTL